MQNCLGELNLTYCLIYLDDVIVFSDMPDEHLWRMHVVFDHLCKHGLKLKLSKCEVFKSEINYLAHHVSRKGVLPSKKNLESIAQCPPPDTYGKALIDDELTTCLLDNGAQLNFITPAYAQE